MRDWPRSIEAINEYLGACLGETKIRLAYVVRHDEAIPDGQDPADDYASVHDEMIARAHISEGGPDTPDTPDTQTYLMDRHRVWELITQMTHELDCWIYVRPAQRAHDGRLAYYGLYDHYLGANNVNNMATLTERQLYRPPHSGERRRWNFEKFMHIHVEQHSILQGLKQNGYARIDERSKVRLFMEGIKTKKLDSIKTCVS